MRMRDVRKKYVRVGFTVSIESEQQTISPCEAKLLDSMVIELEFQSMCKLFAIFYVTAFVHGEYKN